MRRLSNFLGLSGACRVRLLLAALLLVAAQIGLTVFPFSRVRSVFLHLTETDATWLPGSLTTDRVAWTVEVADGHVPGTRTCLMRSLATEALLRMEGYAPRHRIGVDRSDDGSIEAHSWIECRGRILIGELDDLSRYEPLPPLVESDES